jgi:PAS domain S-box-containing protein
MKGRRSNILKLGILLVLVTVIFIVYLLIDQASAVRTDSAFVSHTNEVLYSNQKLVSGLSKLRNAALRFLISADKVSQDQLHQLPDSIAVHAAQLSRLTADNPDQHRRLMAFTAMLDSIRTSLFNTNGAPDPVVMRNAGMMANIDRAMEQLDIIEKEENTLLAERKLKSQSSSDSIDYMFTVLWVIVVLLAAIVFWNLRADYRALRRSEQKRTMAERQLQLLLKNVKDYGIFTTNREGDILTWTEGAAAVTGYEEKDLPGRNVLSLHPDASPAELQYVFSAAEKKGNFESTGIRHKKDGSRYIAHDVITALYDEHRQLQGFAWIVRDITNEQKKIEEIDYLSRLVSQTSDAIFSTDTQFVIRSWNRAATELYGYSAEQAIGVNIAVLLKSRLTDSERRRSIAELNSKGYYEGEFGFYNKSNELKYVLASVSVLRNPDDSIAGYIGIHKDISERRALEEQLQQFNHTLEQKVHEQTEELKAVFERITDGFVAFDRNWNYTYINQKAADLFGASPEALMGQNLWQVFPAFEATETSKVFRKAMRDQLFDHNIEYFEPFDCWVENYIYPSPQGISIFVRDISEQKRAELKVVNSEKRFRALMQNSADGLILMDADTRITSLTPSAVTILGYSAEELMAPDRVNHVHEHDKAAQSQIIELVKSRPGAIATGEHRYVLPGGRIKWIECTYHNLLEEEYVNAIVLNFRDITSRKIAEEQIRRSEHKYRLLFENNPVPMWMSSVADLQIVDVNEAALRQYGYTRNEFLELHGNELQSGDFGNVHIGVEEPEDGQQGASIQWRHRRKDGSVIFVEIYNYRIIYESRPVWLWLSIDISGKKAAEEKLKKSYQDIRQLASHLQEIREEERASMAREIHDELGQQLTGLKMDISWLARKKDLTQEQREQKIREILKFLDGTVNTVRRLSSELRPGILDDLGLGEALGWWAQEFEKRSGVQCVVETPAEVLPLSSHQAVALFRVFQESLTNVARHAKASMVKSSLTRLGDVIVLRITDNGAGFDTRTSAQKKTLGLLGMKERTLMLGGQYEISSEPGQGTTVTVTVPLEPIAKTVKPGL